VRSGGLPADRYEKAHPGVKVEFDYLENEAFKVGPLQKLQFRIPLLIALARG
jgi:hypothetical protein